MVVGALPPNDHRGQAMHPSISLTPDERNTLLDYYRAPFDGPRSRGVGGRARRRGCMDSFGL